MTNLADLAIGQQDLDNIESEFDLWVLEQPQIIERRPRKTLTPLLIDGRGGPDPVLGGPRFDFDEDQTIFLTADEVDLAAVGTEICGEKFEAKFLEMPLGGALAQFTVLEMERTGG